MLRSVRVSCRLLLAAAIAAATVGPSAPPLLAASAPSRTALRVHPALESLRWRIDPAAALALSSGTAWLGPPPFDPAGVVIVPALEGGAAGAGEIAVRAGWRPDAGTMDVESQVAWGVLRRWWCTGAEPDAATRTVVDGMAWYLQSRVVEQAFDERYARRAHSLEAVRFFGGEVTWAFALLPRARATAGLAREIVAGDPGNAWPQTHRRLPPEVGTATARWALAFGTLERYLGWPTVQGALMAAAGADCSQAPAVNGMLGRFGRAAGRDLSWFFDAVADPDRTFGYAVTALSSTPGESGCPISPCVVTRVTVARRGNAAFTGTSRRPQGPFDAGDAVGVAVSFTDGQSVIATWDGRDVERTIAVDAPAPAMSAEVDPARVLLLDLDTLDNRRVAEPRVRPLGKWIAMWVIWLQDAMLAGASLF